ALFGTFKTALQGVINWCIDKINWFIGKVNDVAGAIASVLGINLKLPTIGHVHFADQHHPATSAAVAARERAQSVAASGGELAARERARQRAAHEHALYLRVHGRQHQLSQREQQHAARTHAMRTATANVGAAAEKGIATLRLSGLTSTQKQYALQNAIDQINTRILSLQTQRQDTRSKAEKKSLENEIQILELRKRGYELQKTELDQRIAASKKTTAAATKQHKEAEKAAKEANKRQLAALKAVPSRQPAQELRKQQLASQLAAAKATGNVPAETRIKSEQLALDRSWVAADQKKLATINRALASRGLSGARRAALIKDKTALMAEITSLGGKITALSGGTGSASVGGTGGTSASGFDIAPAGSSGMGINVPTAYDVRRAMRGGTFGHHTNHNNITIHVHNRGDLPKVVEVLERATSTHLHSKMRAAGLRGT
ncbi:MAG TPA: hypothetical protein VGH56_02735, partial [Solirubrobacteraceae bacterium]